MACLYFPDRAVAQHPGRRPALLDRLEHRLLVDSTRPAGHNPYIFLCTLLGNVTGELQGDIVCVSGTHNGKAARIQQLPVPRPIEQRRRRFAQAVFQPRGVTGFGAADNPQPAVRPAFHGHGQGCPSLQEADHSIRSSCKALPQPIGPLRGQQDGWPQAHFFQPVCKRIVFGGGQRLHVLRPPHEASAEQQNHLTVGIQDVIVHEERSLLG